MNKDTRPDIPEGVVRNKFGQVLTNKRGRFWIEKTYTDTGLPLSYWTSDGNWYECFYDLNIRTSNKGTLSSQSLKVLLNQLDQVPLNNGPRFFLLT